MKATVVRLMVAVFFIAAFALATPACANSTPDGDDTVKAGAPASPEVKHPKYWVNPEVTVQVVERRDGAYQVIQNGKEVGCIGKCTCTPKKKDKDETKPDTAGTFKVVDMAGSGQGLEQNGVIFGPIKGCTCSSPVAKKKAAPRPAPPTPVAAPLPVQPIVVAPPPAPAPVCNRSAAPFIRDMNIHVEEGEPYCVKGGHQDLSVSKGDPADNGDSIGGSFNGAFDGYDRVNVGGKQYVSCTMASPDAATKLTREQLDHAIEWGHYDANGNRVCQWQRENPTGEGCPHAVLVAFDNGCDLRLMWRVGPYSEASSDTTSTAIGVPGTSWVDKGFYVATPDSIERIIKPEDCGDGSDAQKCQKAYRSINLSYQ